MRILVVAKDENLNNLIKKALQEASYTVDEAFSIKDAKYFLDVRNYNLVIVDLSIGKSEVYRFIDNIKEYKDSVKVIAISDDTSVDTEIKTLKMGADDFIRKPLNLDLLILRTNIALQSSKERKLRIKDLIIYQDEEKIIYNNQEVFLKGKPFEVFLHLAKYPNQVISKEQLLDAIWEEPELVTPNVIEVAVNHIRQKVDKVFKIDTIKTIRRRGYKFSYPKE